MKDKWGNASQVDDIREHPNAADAVPLPRWGRGRYENAAFPILSFRAKARNLFRSRSGKGCEDSGEREAPCSQRIGRTVFHADSITKENGNGKRKRSLGCARDDETRERLFPFLFNLLRKPTPPRCAQQPLPREGARVDAPSFLWKEVPRRGGGWRGKALSPTHCLPLKGEGAPKGRIGYWRYERERGGSSQVGDIREHPIHRCAVPLPQWGR